MDTGLKKNDLNYSHKKAKKFAIILQKNIKFIFKPEHKYYGDLTHRHHLWSNCSVILQTKIRNISH